VESVGSRVPLEQLVTMEEGSSLHKLRVFAHALLTMRRMLRQRYERVFHIHFSKQGSTFRKMMLARMAMRRGMPVVFHAHSGGYAAFLSGLPKALKDLVCATLQRADRIIVLSSQWRDYYVNECGIDPTKVRVMPNPTRIPRELPNRETRRAIQFLFLGRISNAKGAFDLLQAFSQLRCEEPSAVRLVFAGDGEVEKMREQARSLGDRVRVFAWIDAQRRDELLRESDVFVLPSYAEGMPMSLLEAMAFGMPVITTNVGGIPDVVADKVEGRLIEAGQIATLSRAMQQMLDDRSARLRMGSNARARAEEFDVERYAEKLIALYTEVAEAPVKSARSQSTAAELEGSVSDLLNS
jgi:glycosyltransferase involved in cell wall biosynthesis